MSWLKDLRTERSLLVGSFVWLPGNLASSILSWLLFHIVGLIVVTIGVVSALMVEELYTGVGKVLAIVPEFLAKVRMVLDVWGQVRLHFFSWLYLMPFVVFCRLDSCGSRLVHHSWSALVCSSSASSTCSHCSFFNYLGGRDFVGLSDNLCVVSYNSSCSSCWFGVFFAYWHPKKGVCKTRDYVLF